MNSQNSLKEINVEKYAGHLTILETQSFLEAIGEFLSIRLNAIIIHIKPSGNLQQITLEGKYLDFDSCRLGGYSWSEKFTRIPTLPKEKTEKTNSVTLPSGDVLSFRDERWWITRSRGGGIEECLRSEAHNLLRQNCLVNAVTDEAWADVIKPNQPFLTM